MSPYRENALPTAPKPRPWGFKDWFRCHILSRHVQGECRIKCGLEECNHTCCIYCEHMDITIHIPENKPRDKDLISCLIWARGCFHAWRTLTSTLYDRNPMQQCMNCPEQRMQRFPTRAP